MTRPGGHASALILAPAEEAAPLCRLLPAAVAVASMPELQARLPAGAVVLSEAAMRPGELDALQAWPEVPVILLTAQPAASHDNRLVLLPSTLEPASVASVVTALLRAPARQRAEKQVRQRDETQARQRDETQARQRDETQARQCDGTQARQRDETQARRRGQTQARRRAACAQDQTQTRQREAAQDRTMAAIAHFAGCLAHDVNNLLTGVMGGLELIQRRTQEPRTARLAAQGLAAAARGSRLVRPLQRIAQLQPLELAPVLLSDHLAAMRAQLQEALGPGIALRLELDPALPPARTDPGELELAMLQIAANAREAMPSGGTLHVATLLRRQTDGAEYPRAVITARDTGRGMDAATVERAFEPYFTTKAADGHRGLGLTQVYGLAHQSGGRLLLHSAPGAGTTVTLELPLAEAAPSG